MNIKIFIHTFILCIGALIISELSTSQLLTTTATTQQKFSYIAYLQQMVANLFSSDKDIKSQKKFAIIIENNKPTTITDLNISEIASDPINDFSNLSRNEALEVIRSITGKIFDINDPYHISMHLADLEALTKNLDPIIDKKTIVAIKFLVENQHRSSLLDTIFWIKMIKEKELETSIPVTEQVFNMSKTDKLQVLRSKLSAKKNTIEAA